MQALTTRWGGSYIRREPIIEVAGYAGAAVSLAAAGIVLGDTASSGVQILVDAITAFVLLGAGVALTAEGDSYRRMKSVFWFLSVCLVIDLAGTLFADGFDITSPRTVVTLTGLVGAAYALVLWLNSRRSLQIVALVLATYAFLVGLVFPDVGGFIFGAPDLSGIAFMTWVFGWLVVGAGAFGVLRPRKTAIVLGSIGAVFGPLLLAVNGKDVLGEILSIGSAIVLIFMGDAMEELVATGLGIAGTLFTSALIVGRHVTNQGPAIAVLLVGLVLLGAALAAARGTGGPAEPAVSAWISTAPPTPPSRPESGPPSTPPVPPPWPGGPPPTPPAPGEPPT